ncbi:ectoine hydroxylase [Paenibacillus aquistagni]|uniref:Ectoine hydroxylase n=1 Tax=Paenibacillus aquistagni TaxID=1852522 RepID=A0A1X7LV30_9BACL|nr:ectoine hydroxylase [Paenibacillus aquistagni]SMG57540.1 ectoine hydroxylase [Paenibacillus aquistagni]
MKTEANIVNKVNDVYPSRIAAKPSIEDRKDPVVYSSWTESSPLTKEQTEFYEKNGYLFLEEYFTEEEVQAWKQELKQLQSYYKEQESEHVIREPESHEVRSIFAVHDNNAIFKALAKHEKLTSIMEYLLGSKTYIHQSRINFKPGFTGKEFYWHSDFETWHVEDGMPLMRALSCSIALEDNNHFNGALMVIPGSHKSFVSCVGATPENHYKDSLRKQEYGVPDPDSLTKLADEGGIQMPIGKAGSVLLFDCNIMHGSGSNISPYPRSNVFMVYNSVENKLAEPFSGQQPRPDYIANRSI